MLAKKESRFKLGLLVHCDDYDKVKSTNEEREKRNNYLQVQIYILSLNVIQSFFWPSSFLSGYGNMNVSLFFKQLTLSGQLNMTISNILLVDIVYK